jgi:hypothetical protein
MESNAHADSETPVRTGGTPGDVPSARAESLDHFEALIGVWEMEASFRAGYFAPGSPPVTNRGGLTTFEWLEGKHFVVQRFVNEHPAAPSGIAIIGAGHEPERLQQHYYDSRGVSRVYGTSLEGGIWRLWRETTGFWQRYTGLISEDLERIEGRWEGSRDGRDWTHDFDLTYIKTPQSK